jgi:hypothetical protein
MLNTQVWTPARRSSHTGRVASAVMMCQVVGACNVGTSLRRFSTVAAAVAAAGSRCANPSCQGDHVVAWKAEMVVRPPRGFEGNRVLVPLIRTLIFDQRIRHGLEFELGELYPRRATPPEMSPTRWPRPPAFNAPLGSPPVPVEAM